MTEVTERVEEARRRRFPRYPAYRDSGIEWLGEIPVHWGAKRLKFVAPARISKLAAKPDDSLYVGLEHVESWTGRLLIETQPDSVDSLVSLFAAGDVLIGKLRPYLAKAARPDFDGVCTSEILPLRPTPGFFQSYLMYCLLSEPYVRWLDSLTYGAKMPRVSPDQIANSNAPVPPEFEQRTIASFLDRETARIDGLVQRKERLIELLHEKRTALITRAVARGLDLGVPMKDSGVDWLGQIPAHWRVGKLKHVCKRVFVGIAEAATFAYVDKGVPMLRSTDVRANRVRTDDIRCLDVAFANKLVSKQLRTNDIVTVRTGNAGVSAVVPPAYDRGQCFTLVVSRPTRTNDSRYFCYWLNARVGQDQFAVEGAGTAQVNISVPIVQNVVVCVPPAEEQVLVANWIEQEVLRWDRSIARISHAIGLLREFRTALISAAVTGKIDVRTTSTEATDSQGRYHEPRSIRTSVRGCDRVSATAARVGRAPGCCEGRPGLGYGIRRRFSVRRLPQALVGGL